MSRLDDHHHGHGSDNDNDNTHVILNPLLLPEVLRLIGPHLSQASNVASLRVCRTWNLNLTPFLFRDVLLPKRSNGKPKATGKTSKRALRPLVSALQRNGYMIRALHCEDNTLLRQISSFCVHLETLVLGKVTSEVLPILRLNQGTLVRLELTPEKRRLPMTWPRAMREDQDDEDDNNSMFTSSSSTSASPSSSPFLSPLPSMIPPPVLTVDHLLNSPTHPFTGTNPKPEVPVKELIQAIMRLERLEHLILDYLCLSPRNELFVPLFEFCRDHLKTLELHNNALLDGPPRHLTFPKLRALALVNSSMSMLKQLQMVSMQATQLKHLSWIHQQFQIPLQGWAHCRTLEANSNHATNNGIIISPEMGQFLSSLDISHSVVRDEMIERCLDAHPQLERLVARDCSNIGSKSVDAIIRLKNLQVLDLRDCHNITPEVAFNLLRGCTAMRSLSLDRAWIREFLQWSPEEATATWTSTQTLEELRVVFVRSLLDRTPSLRSFEVQQTIYRHLSKFTRLRLLNLGRSGAVKWSAKSVLDLSLANGLNHLAGLTELREFDFCQMNHRLGMEEVKWMLAHWSRLEKMAGYLSNDPDRAGFMESFVRHERPGIVLKHKLKYKKDLCKPKLWNRDL
ncbi:hypothetical protein BG006_003869 [Podila minutissima]|uniref:F-box domain-containing protein n=1 Tax=Podila minutissima TaxID=64525 RepID=A0A9P5VMP1_9FUNG|nr:hypothetical protein BG006_003869 [Podila minutissima]